MRITCLLTLNNDVGAKFRKVLESDTSVVVQCKYSMLWRALMKHYVTYQYGHSNKSVEGEYVLFIIGVLAGASLINGMIPIT